MVYTAFFTYLPTWIVRAGGFPILQIRILRFGEVKISLRVNKSSWDFNQHLMTETGLLSGHCQKPSSHIWYLFTTLF